MDKDLERVFNEWVATIKDPKAKETVEKLKVTYIAWLVFFLQDTIKKNK